MNLDLLVKFSKSDERNRMRSFAVEILLEEMRNRQGSNQESLSEFSYTRCSFSTDSGMEDGSTSPASSVSSGSSEIRGLSAGSEDSPTLTKPSFITPSECSAFSKIDRKNIEQFQFPNLVPVNPFCPPLGVGYLPGMCLPPWSMESIPGGASFQLPRGLPEGCLSSYPTKADEENEEAVKMENVDKNAFYYVDTKIPFTNYFLNLTRIFQRGSTENGQESENTDMKKELQEGNDEKKGKEDSISETRQKDRMDKKLYSKTKFESEIKPSVSPDNLNVSPRMYNTTGSFGVPGQVIPNLPPPSLLQFMNSVNAPPSVFHPAFLQMNGVGMKRLPSDKPPPVKKYKCDVCGKAFSRSNTLVTHKRIHTGDKPFKCESCGRAFRQPGNLTRHRLTHTTVKPYVCPHCNKAFNRASNLNTHMRTHTNYKPYMCPYCGKGFHQKIDMKIHCYTHTNRIPTQI